jgi:hypothetical protein
VEECGTLALCGARCSRVGHVVESECECELAPGPPGPAIPAPTMTGRTSRGHYIRYLTPYHTLFPYSFVEGRLEERGRLGGREMTWGKETLEIVSLTVTVLNQWSNAASRSIRASGQLDSPSPSPSPSRGLTLAPPL